MLRILHISRVHVLHCSKVIYPISLESKISYSTSEAEPDAMFRKFANSAFVRRPHPSAILVGIDETALRIYDVKPKTSSFGN